MRRRFASLLVFLFALMTALPTLAASFSDTSGHWAEPSVNEAADKGLIGGNPDGTFRPDDPLTRAAFVTLIAKAMKLPPLVPAAPTFADTAGHWVVAQGHLEAAVREGIVTAADYGDALEPDRPIPREEIAAMAVRALGIDQWGQQPTGTDADAITAVRRDQVAAGQDLGIVTGFPDGSFQPQETATRAQAAVIILRVAERLDRLARPVLPAGYEEQCSPGARVEASSAASSTVQLLEESAAVLGIALPDSTPARPPLCEGSDNPQLQLVELIIAEAKAAAAAGDVSRAERLRAEGLTLLRSLPSPEGSLAPGLVAMAGPKLAAAGSGSDTTPKRALGRREVPKSITDRMGAARQASDLGDGDLSDRELDAAKKEYKQWADEQVQDLRRKARAGDFDELDARDAYNIWNDSTMLAQDEAADLAKDAYGQMTQGLFERAADNAQCPPSDAEMDEIYTRALKATMMAENEDTSNAIFKRTQLKMEQSIRQRAQAPDANFNDLANLASRWGLDELVGEFNQYLNDGQNHVKPPRCEVTWSGTISVVRAVQYHRFASSPEEGTEDSDFQATYKVDLALDKGEAAWESDVTGSGGGEWVMHEESEECGPSVIRTDTNYEISGSGGSSLRPIKPSITVQEDGQYTIAFSVPAASGLLEGHTSYEATGGCFPDTQDVPLSLPLDETELMPGFEVMIDENAGKPNPGYLKGSTTKIQQIDGGQIKDEIEWELWKVRPA